jgi:hypothetical protein
MIPSPSEIGAEDIVGNLVLWLKLAVEGLVPLSLAWACCSRHGASSLVFLLLLSRSQTCGLHFEIDLSHTAV